MPTTPIKKPTDAPLTDDQRQYLGTVERNAQRLLRLVGDLLFTAQVDAGRLTLTPEDVDLAAIVRAAEGSVRDALSIDLIVARTGITKAEAYALCSLAADLRITLPAAAMRPPPTVGRK